MGTLSGWFAVLIASIFIETATCNHQFLSLSDEDSCLHQKKFGMYIPFFVFTASIVLDHQCVVLHYLALQLQCCIIMLNSVAKILPLVCVLVK